MGRKRGGLWTAQAWAAGIAVSGMVAAEAQGALDVAPSDTKGAIAVCAAERAPIAARKKEYDDLKKARLGKAIGQGVAAGAGVLMGGMMSGGFGGMGGGFPGMGGRGGSPMAAMGGMAGMIPGAPPGFSDPSGVFGQALGMNIPGVTTGGAGYGGYGGSDYSKGLIAISLITAVASTVEAYSKLKLEQNNNDLRQMAEAVDGDAGTQTPVAQEMNAQVTSLSECRQQQVQALELQLSSAANDKDRKKLSRSQKSLQAALKTDIDLNDDVVGQQANLTKTFTQTRAMSEGRSEAEVLGGQKPAYADVASTTRLSLPGQAPAADPPPPPPPTIIPRRAVVVRSAPNIKASPVKSLPAGKPVTPMGKAAQDDKWWEVEVGDVIGYVRVADLPDPNAKAGPSGPPPLAPANNIRNLNRQVLAAKTNGSERLKTLSTEVQAMRMRTAPVLLARR